MRPHGVIFFGDSARRGILDLSAFLTERGELRYSIQLDSRSNGSASPGLETLKQIIPICQVFEDSAELTVEQLVEKFISAASAAGIRYKKPTLLKREKRFMLFLRHDDAVALLSRQLQEMQANEPCEFCGGDDKTCSACGGSGNKVVQIG